MEETNLVYIALVDHEIGGVEQKILGQFDALKAQGIAVHLLLVTNKKLSDNFLIQVERRENVSHLLFESHTNFIRRRFEKFQFILDNLKIFKPEKTTIYMRFPAADAASYLFFKTIKTQGFRVFTEHQQIENPYRQFNFIKGYLGIALFLQ
jgi:hypothetical protein